MLTLADNGKTNYVICVALDAPTVEQNAAKELASYLKKISGASFPVVESTTPGKRPLIAVGPDAAIASGAFKRPPAGLGDEGYIVRVAGKHLILTGGKRAPRGTLYAVYSFLEEQLGCRWWTPKVEFIPRMKTVEIPPLKKRFVPILEYRETFLRDALEARWSVRNKVNALNAHPQITDEWGGRVIYMPGHTFHALVPPSEHFAIHPEWYAEIDGQRTTAGQLCLTNRALAAFVTERVKEQLSQLPPGAIVSVAQDDNAGYCRCGRCREVDQKEGSQAGTILRFVNTIAAGIEKEFPKSAINTFAYTYSRKPPRYVKARRNVIVQLCSYECDFLHPMTHRNNAPFRRDLQAWSTRCRRLYLWDYVTNFAHYVQPHPSWYVAGDNIRFFVAHHVKGIFNEGNYQSPGGEMSALRAWVLAKLMWNPSQSAEALVDEFLAGYYGRAGVHIGNYMRRVHAAGMSAGDYPGSLSIRRLLAGDSRYARYSRKGLYLDLGVPPDAPHLASDVMLEALRHFQAAESAVRGDAVLLSRVQLARLPVLYVTLIRWTEIRRRARETGQAWLLPRTREQAYRGFATLCRRYGITHLGEGRQNGLAWLRKMLRGKAPWSW